MPVKPRPLSERFATKVDRSDPSGCWIWTGARTGSGYGTISSGGRRGRNIPAHRVSWELAHGPIPGRLQVDHLCRNTLCVNPDHLELVTQAENIRRGLAHSRAVGRGRYPISTTCGKGHTFTSENTRWYTRPNGDRWRECQTCARARSTRKNAARAARRAAPIPTTEA